MAGMVTFEVTAEVARAVEGLLKVNAAAGKVSDGLKQSKDHGTQLTHTLEGVGDGLKDIIRDAAGFAGVSAMMLTTFHKVTEELAEENELLKRFIETARGGMSLPANIRDPIGYLKTNLDLSKEFGIDKEAVNAVRQQVGVEAGWLSPDQQMGITRSALGLQDLIHASASDSARVEDSLVSGFAMTPKAAENMMLTMRNVAHVDIGEQAQLLPEVAPILESMKMGPDQFAAALGTLQQSGGDVGQLTRGFREALMKMEGLSDPNRKGGAILHGGDLQSQLAELEKLRETNPAEFETLMGRRSAPAIAYLAGHRNQFAQELALVHAESQQDQAQKIIDSFNQHPQIAAQSLDKKLDQVAAGEGVTPSDDTDAVIKQRLLTTAHMNRVATAAGMWDGFHWLGTGIGHLKRAAGSDADLMENRDDYVEALTETGPEAATQFAALFGNKRNAVGIAREALQREQVADADNPQLLAQVNQALAQLNAILPTFHGAANKLDEAGEKLTTGGDNRNRHN